MRNVLLGLLSVVSLGFGLSDVHTIVDGYKPDGVFTLGDITVNGIVYGTAYCKDNKYTIGWKVVNLNTKYYGIFETQYDDRKALNHGCAVLSNATEIPNSGYDGVLDGCYYIFKHYTNPNMKDSLGRDETVAVREQFCPTMPSPLNPFEKQPILKASGRINNEESDEMINAIANWNTNNNLFDYLWIDQEEDRFRPTKEEFQQIINGAMGMGTIFDDELGMYGEITTSTFKTTKGNPDYRFINGTSLMWAKETVMIANRYVRNYEYKYSYECYRANSGRGDDGISYGYVVARVYNMQTGEETDNVIFHPAMMNNEGNYACNSAMKGAELTKIEFYTYAFAGQRGLIPIYIKK